MEKVSSSSDIQELLSQTDYQNLSRKSKAYELIKRTQVTDPRKQMRAKSTIKGDFSGKKNRGMGLATINERKPLQNKKQYTSVPMVEKPNPTQICEVEEET
jgi:hypothetical protein